MLQDRHQHGFKSVSSARASACADAYLESTPVVMHKSTRFPTSRIPPLLQQLGKRRRYVD